MCNRRKLLRSTYGLVSTVMEKTATSYEMMIIFMEIALLRKHYII